MRDSVHSICIAKGRHTGTVATACAKRVKFMDAAMHVDNRAIATTMSRTVDRILRFPAQFPAYYTTVSRTMSLEFKLVELCL